MQFQIAVDSNNAVIHPVFRTPTIADLGHYNIHAAESLGQDLMNYIDQTI